MPSQKEQMRQIMYFSQIVFNETKHDPQVPEAGSV